MSDSRAAALEAREGVRSPSGTLLHNLSLDAPLLAVAWAALFAQRTGGGLDPKRLALLGAGVWLAYSADRWLDGLRLERGQAGTERHEFAIRHRAALLAVWSLVLTLSAGWAPFVLGVRELSAALVLAAGGGIYVVACQLWPRALRQRPPRELLVGALVAVSVLLFSGAGAGSGFLIAAFGALCALDCAAISAWEASVDARRAEPSLALSWPRLKHWLPTLCAAVMGLGALGLSRDRAIGGALVAGGVLIAGLDRRPWLGAARPILLDLWLAGIALAALGIGWL